MGFRPDLSSAGKKRIIAAALAFCLLLLVGPASQAAPKSEPDQIILSWIQDPQTSQTISWRAETVTDQNKVQYLLAEEFEGSFQGAQQGRGRPKPLHEGYSRVTATLTGLIPGRSYVYRVGGDGGWSEPACFTTAAASDSFSFLYLGDVQAGYDAWGQMVQKIKAQQPDLKFALAGGDLVDKGNSSQQWQQFLAAAEPVFKEIPLLAAVGNHDDSPLFRDYLALPQNGPAENKGTIYSFDYGNCHFTVLNSNVMGIPGTGAYDRVSAWLREDLAASQKMWKVAVFHHPPYQAVQNWRGHHLQTNWVPLLEEGGVDLLLSGHQHVYLRTKPLWQGEIRSDGKGIVYIIGNSGPKHYAPGPDYDYVAAQVARVSNYQSIKIQGNTLSLTSKGAAGTVLDQITLTKAVPHQTSSETGASAKAELKPLLSPLLAARNLVSALVTAFVLPL